MAAQLADSSSAKRVASFIALRRGVVWGLIGGLVGTVVMDLVLIGTFTAVGLPAIVSFSTIGDTAAGFFAVLGIQVTGGFALGALVHYLMGLGLGAIFGIVTSRVNSLRPYTLKKGIVLGILYIEVVSQPILALSPIFLKMTLTDTLLWFGVSAVMHFIWGLVLGLFVSYGLRDTTTPMTREFVREPRPSHP